MGTKTRQKPMVWIWGNKKKGVSVYKLSYNTPLWRIGVWVDYRLYRTYEYEKKAEAIREARGYAESYKKRGIW